MEYASLAEQKDKAVSAPVYDDLFMLAALGSRGLCSAPLLCRDSGGADERRTDSDGCQYAGGVKSESLWVRKLLKGKAVRLGNQLWHCLSDAA
ncbi:tRNA U-34 5-methylaminomethyl-2-thiouridine biosynthesis protein MnmC [Escherichia coli]|nr:tRNA U-34 5-methylaminomethyl-2-thiouridine biosynthesis protein MnmC [Escherichia coli]